MTARKITDGSMTTCDKIFDKDADVEITKEDYEYLKDTFGDVFVFEGVEAPKKKEESKKGN